MADAKRRILVVDDDAAVRDALKHQLLDRGYAVETATDGQDALVLVQRIPRPDAIILDLMMPIMSGWEFLEAKAGSEQIRSVPVLILTAHDHEPLQLRNVLGVFRKSRDLSRMFGALDEHLRQSA